MQDALGLAITIITSMTRLLIVVFYASFIYKNIIIIIIYAYSSTVDRRGQWS